MKPKLIAIFLLIVLSPLALLAWLGWRATADEQARVQATVTDAYANQLSSLRSLVHETITEREREFADLLELGLVRRGSEIRSLIRSQRFVRQVFIIGPDGKFFHPPPGESLRTEPERRFFERTSSVWLSGEKFAISGNDAPPAISGNDAPPADNTFINQVFAENLPNQSQLDYSQSIQANDAWSKQQEAVQNTFPQQRARLAPTNFATDQGWYTWFHGDGVQIIYWRHITGPNYTLGIEVDREALMAEVIAKLPSDTGAGAGSIALTDASARPLYQWGELEPDEGATPNASLPLFAPLSMWHLNHYAPGAVVGKLSTNTVLGLVSGIIAAAVALLALAIYFYRENSREMRTAAEKVTFVNQVSHELKTPLTNIRMYAELAEDKIPDGEENGARRCLDIVVNESQRLSRLIGNVLTFARPKAQQPNPTPKVADDIVRETLEHFRPALEAQEIAIDFQPGASKSVRLDADFLEQILGNLLGNVEKYAASGKSLEISTSQDQHLTTITVTDHGPGIPKNQREKIFKPFHRLSNKLSDGVSGTGIGLTIARDLARRHGGDLTLSESKNPQGCHFTLTLKTESA